MADRLFFGSMDVFSAAEARRLQLECQWLADRIRPIHMGGPLLAASRCEYAVDDLDLVPYEIRDALPRPPAIFSTTRNRARTLSIWTPSAGGRLIERLFEPTFGLLRAPSGSRALDHSGDWVSPDAYRQDAASAAAEAEIAAWDEVLAPLRAKRPKKATSGATGKDTGA
jgi:hypothetical protein